MIYIKVDYADRERSKTLLEENGIKVHDVFSDVYHEMCKTNVEYFIDSIELDGDVLDIESERDILQMDEKELETFKEKTICYLYDNEYLSQTFNECTTDAIGCGLRELFIERN